MAGYVKRIALIKTLRQGYSADGGELKGLVRCEAYAGFLKAEVSLINFAPLSEGEYRVGLSDGRSVVVFGAPAFEGECDFDPSGGFACLVAYCRAGGALPVASAVCGGREGWLADAQRALERGERAGDGGYDDEAIADENYYDVETDENGGTVRADEKAGEGQETYAHEARSGACGGKAEEGDAIKYASRAFRIGGSPAGEDAAGADGRGPESGDGADAAGPAGPAESGFYERMSGDVKKIFATYPRAVELEKAVPGSRWAKISYGSGAHYAFGVIYEGGNAKYLCYAVPVAAGAPCPPGLSGRAGYIPVEGGGYWTMYQDARTGISLKVQ